MGYDKDYDDDYDDDYEESPPPKGMSPVVIVVIVVAAVGLCLVIPCIAAIAIPNLIETRQHGNEAAAIGALKTVNTAQSLFREGDKDEDGTFDYGSLQELSNTMLIDGVLGSGMKHGYQFDVQASPQTSEFLWMAVANPAVPETTGSRYFMTNHAGVVFYRMDRPFVIDPVGNPAFEPPPDAIPVGR